LGFFYSIQCRYGLCHIFLPLATYFFPAQKTGGSPLRSERTKESYTSGGFLFLDKKKLFFVLFVSFVVNKNNNALHPVERGLHFVATAASKKSWSRQSRENSCAISINTMYLIAQTSSSPFIMRSLLRRDMLFKINYYVASPRRCVRAIDRLGSLRRCEKAIVVNLFL